MALQGYRLKMASRSERRAKNQLGIINLSDAKHRYRSQEYRAPELECFDAYYEKRQYDDLTPWQQALDDQFNYIPVRKRQPRINYNFAKALCAKVATRLIGADTWPRFAVAEDPDFEQYLRFIAIAANLQANLLEPMRRVLAAGSCFVRFAVVDGKFVFHHYLGKYCYPTFSANGELQAMRVQYTYEDATQVDDMGRPKKFWYRLDLTATADILFDNPEYDPEQPREEVEFQEVARAEHNLGFVQGQWFRTTMPTDDKVDGPSLYSDVLGFIDEINYALSQSTQAVSYNQDPQLTLNGMNEEECDSLIKSAAKAWNLGKEGEAKFVESTLVGVERGFELCDKLRTGIMQIARVVFLDEQKINLQALSGKAMEIMHAPMVELINELRPVVGPALRDLLLKLAVANLVVAQSGQPAPVTMPQGWQPKSFGVELKWPPVFQNTMLDLQQKVTVANVASTANIISRESCTRWLAQDFGIEDVEKELQILAAQEPLNPFGAF